MIGGSWVASQAEIERRYPCDDLAPANAMQLWRGVTVDAPAAAVWPWLRQLRVAPYSYDWLDNLGHRSPSELWALPDPQPGERFLLHRGSVSGRSRAVGPPGRAPHGQGHGCGDVIRAASGGLFYRLLLKIVLDRAHWYAAPLALGDWPMARRQLKNLKQLAEAEWTSWARGLDGNESCVS